MSTKQLLSAIERRTEQLVKLRALAYGPVYTNEAKFERWLLCHRIAEQQLSADNS